MRLNPRPVIPFLIVIAFAFMSAVPAMAQTSQPAPTVKRDFARQIPSVEGKDSYHAYCAVCHGVDLKGHGPAAPAMKVPPTDLTTYAKRHGGKFSDSDMRMVIEGETGVVAHGSGEMPIWGDVFRALTHDRDMRELRMANLIQYLKQMQEK